MRAASVSLSPAETALFQALSNAGLVYLLMLRLRCPLGAREIADILGIHEQTAARHLRRLSKLNLVARSRCRQGYVLLGGDQLILGDIEHAQEDPAPPELQAGPQEDEDITFFSQYEHDPVAELDTELQDAQDQPYPTVDYCQDADGEEDLLAEIEAVISRRNPRSVAGPAQNSHKPVGPPGDTTKNSQYPSTLNTTTDTSDNDLINLRDSVVVVDQDGKKPKNNDRSAVWEELISAGIGANERTRLLVHQPHVTPEYVRAHHLKLVALGKSGAK